MSVPTVRIRTLNDRPLEPRGRHVLYWMTSFRRARANFALERAIELAQELDRPLVILEALRIGYPFASERLHAFVLEGMADNAKRLAKTRALYLPYVEPSAGAGKGLVEALAAHACAVVGDDWPCLFVPRMQQAAASRIAVRFEVVDSNGLLPMWATPAVFSTAHSLRLYLQKELKPHLLQPPAEDPLAGAKLKAHEGLPAAVAKRWPFAQAELTDLQLLARLPIDHAVKPVAMRGGAIAAEERLRLFVDEKLDAYPDTRNEPEVDGTSKLSPYLHFGHLSVHQVLWAIAKREKWSPEKLGKSNGGAREGWWKMSPAAEGFLDELVTWRELAHNMSSHRPDDYTQFESLPPWALETHAEHAKDPREHLYTLEQLEASKTHDPLWNAANEQLKRDGWYHNYLRMLWGKKLLEWSRSPKEALARMEHLMNRYSLDGRDPISWSGFMWVLGRYDRAWGPERKVFGKIRYMSSENTARKVRVKKYIERYTGAPPQLPLL